MSVSQARSAEALQNVVNNQSLGTQAGPSQSGDYADISATASDPEVSSDPAAPMVDPRRERLRATIRGALGTKKEADMTDSTFLGFVKEKPNQAAAMEVKGGADMTAVSGSDQKNSTNGQTITDGEPDEALNNPVDDM